MIENFQSSIVNNQLNAKNSFKNLKNVNDILFKLFSIF